MYHECCSRAQYRILTVSKLWVTVTAPQAAMPPAMKALSRRVSNVSMLYQEPVYDRHWTYPVVVDISSDVTPLPETGRACCRTEYLYSKEEKKEKRKTKRVENRPRGQLQVKQRVSVFRRESMNFLLVLWGMSDRPSAG